MHPVLAALLVLSVTNCAGTVQVHVHALPVPAAADTPAGHFWREALPGTPMPESIADLVQKGIDHSPLVEPYNIPHDMGQSLAVSILYGCVGGCPDKTAVPPGLFFHKEQLRVGSTMTVTFPPAALPAILPQDVAEKIPFGSLADVLSVFGMAPSSAEAAKVADTLRLCQAAPAALSDEHMACTTSLESTVRSATGMLGTNRVVSVVASELTSAGLPLQPYLVQVVSQVDSGDRHVGCHIMPYPYAVYACHMTGLPSEAYVISLRGLGDGGPAATIAMAAICHLDTSKWNPAYPAFEILHTHPGGAPVCHFMSYANLMFVDKTANT